MEIGTISRQLADFYGTYVDARGRLVLHHQLALDRIGNNVLNIITVLRLSYHVFHCYSACSKKKRKIIICFKAM